MWSNTLPRVATSWQKVLTCKAVQPFWSRRWPATLPASTAAMAVPFVTQDWSEKQCKCQGCTREGSAVGHRSFWSCRCSAALPASITPTGGRGVTGRGKGMIDIKGQVKGNRAHKRGQGERAKPKLAHHIGYICNGKGCGAHEVVG